jgi:hypothetical protein
MPLEPGGIAEKFGNRYEGRWTVRQLLRLLNEDIATVTIEAIGEDEPGVDLWIEYFHGPRQAQQCKWHDKSWTLAVLSSRGILEAAKHHLDRDPSYTFALITAAGAPALEQLFVSARNSNGDPEAFYNHQVQRVSQERSAIFRQFCPYFGLDCDRHHLASHGFQPRRLPNDGRILPAIEELCNRFAGTIQEELITGQIIPRKETNDILEALVNTPVVVLHGSPGRGKTGVLYELTQKLREKNWAFLPIRLDRQEPRNTTQQFGQDIGLPESPVKCLEAIAGPQPAVVLLDQLDAIRWTSRHSLNALDVCKALVREVNSLRAVGKKIGVVLACRTYDLDNDPDIKHWLSANTESESRIVRIEVAPFEGGVVESIVQKQGHIYASRSPSNRIRWDMSQLLPMMVRLYEQSYEHDDFDTMNRCLDTWDAMFEKRVGVVSELAKVIDL